MTRAADALTSEPLGARGLEAVEEVRALASEFDGSPAHLAAARRTTSGRQRWLAIRHTHPSHPAFAPILRLLDALVASDGETTMTDQGPFLTSDLIDAEVKIERDGDVRRFCFPISRPWSRTPDPDFGVPGVRGAAVYRGADQRGPIRGTFAVEPSARSHREREWWEDEA